MKKLLSLTVAGSALLAAACSTAMASQSDDVRIVIQQEGGETETVILRDLEVEVNDGEIIINGENIEATTDGRIIIRGGDVLTWQADEGENTFVFTDADHVLRLAEVEADIDVELDRLENLEIIVEELQSETFADVMATLEVELDQLDNRRVVIVNGERRELTEEEREEIRNELAEAREEVRSAMIEVRREMAESGEERREARRVMLIELENARDEVRRAHREAARARSEARANVFIDEGTIEQIRNSGANRVRIETRNGEDRVWVDGEELEGDARTEWLNRLEIERLEGGRNTRRIEIDLSEETQDE